ncbi:MAG: LemA family protein [Salinivirgaceae bacterium]|nr:LemA family protein [Salinivirgaceae bacterium]
MNKKKYLTLGGVLLFIIAIISWYIRTGNEIIRLDESVAEAWSQVENVYQSRADKIQNLVATVKGYAEHEKTALTDVVEARAKASSVNINPEKLDAESLQQFEEAQGNLSSALSRLLVVVERYPDLKANQNFSELQAQIEGMENRIAVERRKFNEVARAYNTYIRQFPASIVANNRGFEKKAYFEAQPGTEKAPEVKF